MIPFACDSAIGLERLASGFGCSRLALCDLEWFLGLLLRACLWELCSFELHRRVGGSGCVRCDWSIGNDSVQVGGIFCWNEVECCKL